MNADLLEQAISDYLANGGRISAVSVNDHARPKSVPRRRRKVDPAIIEELKRYRDAGVAAAAKALHKHVTTVIRLAAEHDIKFTTPVRENRELARRSANALAPVIRKMVNDGRTQVQIAQLLGIGRCALRRIMSDNGISSCKRKKRFKLE